MDWYWHLLDRTGSAASAPTVMEPEQRFPSQSDAESWLGEWWPQLREAGIDAVELFQGDRRVYGPMSLHP